MSLRETIRAAFRNARSEIEDLAERLLRLDFDESEVMEELLLDLLDRVPAAAAQIDAATNTGIFEPIDEELIQLLLGGVIKVALRRVRGGRTLGDLLRRARGGSARPLSSGT